MHWSSAVKDDSRLSIEIINSLVWLLIKQLAWLETFLFDWLRVKFLIELGVNLDLIDSDGKSALYYACLRKHSKIVKLLSDAGATVQVSKERLC